VRVPDHDGLLRVLRALNRPVALTSANRTGAGDVATLAEVAPDVLCHCCAAVATGSDPHGGGTASTVVDLRPLAHGKTAVVLREGAVSAGDVLARIAAL